MAFNPFHAFRRHQKVMFAVMAIVCMFLFVLSSGMGGGDIFQQLTDYFRTRPSASTVATLFGKNLDAQAIDQVKYQRELASRYMTLAIQTAAGNLSMQLLTDMDKLDPSIKQLVQQLFQQSLQNPSQSSPMFPYMRQIAERSTGPNKNQQIATIDRLERFAALNRRNFDLDRSRGQSYFGGKVSSLEDTLDFLIWRRKAEELGIKFTPVDVAFAIDQDALGVLNDDLKKQVAAQFRQSMRDYKQDTLQAAMANEFAVRAAQAAFSGVSRSAQRTGVPPIVTPEEDWEWYRDVRTVIRVGMIEVPVSALLSQVTAKPTESELKELYNQFKSEEYAPFRDQPGFKEPRKVKVEWFALPRESEYYRNLAKQVDPVLSAMRHIGDAAPMLDTGGLAAATQAAFALMPATDEMALAEELRKYRDAEAKWTDPFAYSRGIHDSSVVEPECLAGLVASTIGGLATGATPMSGPLAFEGRVIVRETQDRIRLGSAGVLARATDPGGLAGSAALAALVAPVSAPVPPPLSADALKPLLTEKYQKQLTEWLWLQDARAFVAEAEKRAKERDKKNVQALINEFVEKRGLKRGSTVELRDQHDIASDPGLEPFRDAYIKRHGKNDPLLDKFAGSFFGAAGELYRLQSLATDDTEFLYWRTEDRESRTLTFDKVRPKVEAAWRLQKARELASKEADRLKAEAQKAGGDVQKLRELAARAGNAEFFEIKPQAKYNPKDKPMPGGSRQYEYYTVPADRVRYAGEAMTNKLIDLRQKSVGTSEVVEDQPKTHFFVAVLLAKDPPTFDEFRQSYVHSMENAVDRDGLLEEYAKERRQNYLLDLLKQLRAEAKLEINKDYRRPSEDQAAE